MFLLSGINHELGGDIDLDAFDHAAHYDPALGRIEMYLVSSKDQRITIGGHEFSFDTGESIHTENSYKSSAEEFSALATRAGFALNQVWTDERAYFAVMLFDAE